MSENVIQTSFSAGELSPNLFARVDLAKFRSGAATMRNFFVDYRSGASTRPGTEFIRPATFSKVRLVRFQQSTTVTFVLEFGGGYLRFISNGGSVVEPPGAITSITQTAPPVVVAFNNFANLDLVFISGVNGMPQINNRYFFVQNVTPGSPGSFTLLDPISVTQVPANLYDPYISGGTVQRVYTISTPYLEGQLPLLKFSQNASVMNITHPAHPPYKLQLISATNWALTQAVFGATVGPPGITGSFPAGAGPASYKYAVTTVDQNNQESTINSSSINIMNSTMDLRTTAGTNLITWTPIPGASSYNVYGTSPSYQGQTTDDAGLGFMGSVAAGISTVFFDSNIQPDFAQTPPIHDVPFAGSFPQVSSFFQQRLVYANGGGNLVQTFWMSRVGAPYNFDISFPPQANDAITGELVSLEVNEIKSLIPMPTGLIMLTTHGAWQVNGGAGGVATQGGPVTPETVTATPQAYIGANDVPPIVINYDIIYVQQKGSIIRDLTFNIYSNIYTGNDISILSSHLFYGHQIVEWAYAEEPFKTIWCVREDGVLLSLALLKEQDMYGWARHDTFGNFKSVCSVTEGSVDAVYVAVERIGPFGSPCRQIERLADRTFKFGAEDAWCVDAGVRTPEFFLQSDINISGATGSVNIFAMTAPVFIPGYVNTIIRAGGGIIKVTQFVAPTQVNGTVIQPITELIPNDPLKRPDTFPSGTWSLTIPFTKVFGLDHLENKEVSVLADGGVINGLVVKNASITLPAPATKVTVGLGFQAQLQTMYLDLGNEINTAQGKRKKVGALTVRVKDSRGVKAGRTFDTVTPIKELNRTTTMGFPIPLVTADERIVMDPLWDVPGQICIQVDDPLPSTILGVIPEIVIGDTQK